MMTRVLVAYATKMGGTAGIAQEVAGELRSRGLIVDLRDVDDAPAVEDYDAVVLGSAMYTGRWRRSAVALLRRLARTTDPPAVWLFHSGPAGPDARGRSVPPPRKVAELAARLGADPPETFGGRIDSATATGFLARKLAQGDLAGDFRDFDRIRAWACTVAASVTVAG